MDCLDSWFMKNLTVKQPVVKILCWHFVYYSSQYRNTKTQMNKKEKTLLTEQHPSIRWSFLTFPCDNCPVDIFRAYEFRGNAKRIQHFDFSFEEDLMQAFQNRSRIWIILIFANFRSKFGFGQKLGDIFRASELRNNRTWTKHFDLFF